MAVQPFDYQAVMQGMQQPQKPQGILDPMFGLRFAAAAMANSGWSTTPVSDDEIIGKALLTALNGSGGKGQGGISPSLQYRMMRDMWGDQKDAENQQYERGRHQKADERSDRRLELEEGGYNIQQKKWQQEQDKLQREREKRDKARENVIDSLSQLQSQSLGAPDAALASMDPNSRLAQMQEPLKQSMVAQSPQGILAMQEELDPAQQEFKRTAMASSGTVMNDGGFEPTPVYDFEKANPGNNLRRLPDNDKKIIMTNPPVYEDGTPVPGYDGPVNAMDELLNPDGSIKWPEPYRPDPNGLQKIELYGNEAEPQMIRADANSISSPPSFIADEAKENEFIAPPETPSQESFYNDQIVNKSKEIKDYLTEAEIGYLKRMAEYDPVAAEKEMMRLYQERQKLEFDAARQDKDKLRQLEKDYETRFDKIQRPIQEKGVVYRGLPDLAASEDGTAHTALIKSFIRMFDTGIVTDAEVRQVMGSGGAMEYIKNLPDRFTQGSILTPKIRFAILKAAQAGLKREQEYTKDFLQREAGRIEQLYGIDASKLYEDKSIDDMKFANDMRRVQGLEPLSEKQYEKMVANDEPLYDENFGITEEDMAAQDAALANDKQAVSDEQALKQALGKSEKPKKKSEPKDVEDLKGDDDKGILDWLFN